MNERRRTTSQGVLAGAVFLALLGVTGSACNDAESILRAKRIDREDEGLPERTRIHRWRGGIAKLP